MVRRFALPVLMLAAVLGCGDDPAPETTHSLLGWVPADTPYAMVSGEPLPSELIERMASMNEAAVAALEGAFAADPDFPAELGEILVELMRGSSGEGAKAFGMGPEDPYVVYGRGIYPAGRFAISDVSNLQQTMTKVETALETKIPTASRNGTTYWRMSGPDFPILLVAVLENDTLSWAVGPVEQENDLVDHLLSDPSPAAAEAFAARVATLRDEYAYDRYPFAFADLEPLVTALTAEAPALAPACREELVAYVRRAPRLVAGYDSITADAMSYTMTLELDESARTALTQASAPIPAADDDGDSLLSIGLGLDISKTANALAASVSATAASTACGDPGAVPFDPSQVQQLTGALQLAGNPRGIRIVWDSIAMDNPASPRVGALALANLEAPGNLLGMMQMQMPLGELPRDGTPVALNDRLQMPLPLQDTIWFASDVDGLGLALGGSDQGPRLQKAMSSQPSATGTLLDFRMSGKMFEMFSDASSPLGAMLASQAANDPAMAGQMRVLQAYGNLLESFSYSIGVSDKGLTLKQAFELK